MSENEPDEAVTQDTPEDEAGYPPDDELDPDTDDRDVVGQAPHPRAAQIRKKALQRGVPQSKDTGKIGKKTTRILAQQKRRQALELRKAGATYQQIAEQVGYADASGAAKAVRKAFQQVVQEPVSDLRVIQIERLNHMLLALWNGVSAGDMGSINTALRVMDKIDALEGTERSRTTDGATVTNNNSILVIDGNKDDYIASLRKMAGAGVGADGTNVSVDHSSQHGGPASLPPGMGRMTDVPVDVIDAEVVEDAEGAVKGVLGDSPSGGVGQQEGQPVEGEQAVEQVPEVPTTRKWNFGVDPTVRTKKAQ